MAGLGQYVHSKNLTYAIYTAESTETCGGYPASQVRSYAIRVASAASLLACGLHHATSLLLIAGV